MTDFPPPGGFQPPGGAAPVPPPAPAAPAPPPYAPAAYGGGWAPAAPTAQAHRPLKGLATAITITLLLCTLASIVAAAAFFSRATAVDDFFKSSATLVDLNDKDDAVRAGSAFFFLALLVTGILWIIWQFRHAKNAERLRGPLGLGPPWAIAGWFIPVGSFILPAMQLQQSAKASDPDLPAGAPASNGKAPGVVVAWAVLFGLSGICFLVASSIRPNDNQILTGEKDFSDFATADRAAAAGMIGFAIASILGILLVRALTERQDRAAATLPPYTRPTPVYAPQPQPQQWGQPQPQAQPQPQQWDAPPPPPPPASPAPPNQWGPPPAPNP